MRHDDEITSDELDGLLDEAETLNAIRPAHGTEVRLYVAVDPQTLHELEHRAAVQGTDLNAVAADALRAGTQAAWRGVAALSTHPRSVAWSSSSAAASALMFSAVHATTRSRTSESKRARSNGLYLSPSARRAETDPSLTPLVTARLQHQCALSVCGLAEGRGRATWVMTEQGRCSRCCRRRSRGTPAMPRVRGRRATATT